MGLKVLLSSYEALIFFSTYEKSENFEKLASLVLTVSEGNDKRHDSEPSNLNGTYDELQNPQNPFQRGMLSGKGSMLKFWQTSKTQNPKPKTLNLKPIIFPALRFGNQQLITNNLS